VGDRLNCETEALAAGAVIPEIAAPSFLALLLRLKFTFFAVGRTSKISLNDNSVILFQKITKIASLLDQQWIIIGRIVQME